MQPLAKCECLSPQCAGCTDTVVLLAKRFIESNAYTMNNFACIWRGLKERRGNKVVCAPQTALHMRHVRYGLKLLGKSEVPHCEAHSLLATGELYTPCTSALQSTYKIVHVTICVPMVIFLTSHAWQTGDVHMHLLWHEGSWRCAMAQWPLWEVLVMALALHPPSITNRELL